MIIAPPPPPPIQPPAIVQTIDAVGQTQQQGHGGKTPVPTRPRKKRSRRLTNEQRRFNRRKREYQSRKAKRARRNNA